MWAVLAAGAAAGLLAGAARAETDFSYGAGAGAYAPGASTSYGVGTGAYAPGAGVGALPRYGAPGSTGSGYRAPSAPGLPAVPLPGNGAAATVRPGLPATANPYGPAAIDTGISPRRPPRGVPAATSGPFGTGGGGVPGPAAPRDSFGR